jgi:hypothetical protein
VEWTGYDVVVEWEPFRGKKEAKKERGIIVLHAVPRSQLTSAIPEDGKYTFLPDRCCQIPEERTTGVRS